MRIGNKISTKRKELGLTQQELADMLYVSVKTVSKWETARGNPEISMLPKIAKVLEIEVGTLLEGDAEVQDFIKPEKKQYNMINAVYHFATSLLGILFYLMTFVTGKVSIDDYLPGFSGFPGFNQPDLSYNFSGYDLLFNSNPENFLGFLLILGLWICFLALLVHIVLGSLEFVNLNNESKHTMRKVEFILGIIGLIAAVIGLIALLSEGLKIGSIMLVLLFAASFVYEIYKRRITLQE